MSKIYSLIFPRSVVIIFLRSVVITTVQYSRATLSPSIRSAIFQLEPKYTGDGQNLKIKCLPVESLFYSDPLYMYVFSTLLLILISSICLPHRSLPCCGFISLSLALSLALSLFLALSLAQSLSLSLFPLLAALLSLFPFLLLL